MLYGNKTGSVSFVRFGEGSFAGSGAVYADRSAFSHNSGKLSESASGSAYVVNYENALSADELRSYDAESVPEVIHSVNAVELLLSGSFAELHSAVRSDRDTQFLTDNSGDQLCLIEAALASGTPVHRNGNDNTHSSSVFSELFCKRQTECPVGIAADTALQLYYSRRDILVIDKCGSEAVCALYREISGETGELSRTLRAEELIIADEFTAYRTSCREKEVQYFLF